MLFCNFFENAVIICVDCGHAIILREESECYWFIHELIKEL